MKGFEEISAIKLLEKSAFVEEAFADIAPAAREVINSARDDQMLALKISRTTPFVPEETKVFDNLVIVEAKIFDKNIFKEMVSSK